MKFEVFDSLLEPAFALDEFGVIIYCNEVAANLLESTPRKLLRQKKSFFSEFQFSSDLIRPETLQIITDATPYQEISYVTAASSNSRAGKAQISCQRMSENRAWLVFFRDVTLEESLHRKYRQELEQKEHYAQNLERLVEEKTAEIRELNVTMKALLDSLRDGFLVFDREGTCLNVSSRACTELLENLPDGKKIWDILKVPEARVGKFKNWLGALFANQLPFEDVAALGPPTFPHASGLHIELAYYKIGNDDDIKHVVLMASDRTELIRARELAKNEAARSKSILQLIDQKRFALTFIEDSKQLWKELDETVTSPVIDRSRLYRILHTLKGGAGMFSLTALVEQLHACEEKVSTGAAETIQRDIQQLRILWENFSAEASRIFGSSTGTTIEFSIEAFKKYLSSKNWEVALKDDLLHYLTSESIESWIRPFDVPLQELANDLGKNILPIRVIGGDLRFAPGSDLQKLFQQFIHFFRNSIDHGLESQEFRRQAKKPAAGQLTFSIKKTPQEIGIEISDDGKGLSRAKLAEKAKALNLTPAMDDELLQIIFMEGFSTAEQVTQISGRGIGLDSVKNEVQRLGGSLKVTSEEGKGTTFQIRLPLSVTLPQQKRSAA